MKDNGYQSTFNQLVKDAEVDKNVAKVNAISITDAVTAFEASITLSTKGKIVPKTTTAVAPSLIGSKQESSSIDFDSDSDSESEKKLRPAKEVVQAFVMKTVTKKADDSAAMKASKSTQKLSTASSNVVSSNTNNNDGVVKPSIQTQKYWQNLYNIEQPNESEFKILRFGPLIHRENEPNDDISDLFIRGVI